MHKITVAGRIYVCVAPKDIFESVFECLACLTQAYGFDAKDGLCQVSPYYVADALHHRIDNQKLRPLFTSIKRVLRAAALGDQDWMGEMVDHLDVMQDTCN